MKDNKTLGRRIQEGRRAAELSQEALGERLGVSRQAVSKWEADAAVPELESLIAMSRLFGVTVGELLGVEEPGAAELTEKDLVVVVEAIAARYTAEPPFWTRRRKLAALSGAVVLALLLLMLLVGLRSLERRMEALEDRLTGLRDQVTALEDAGQTEAEAQPESGVVLKWDVEYTGVTPKAVTFRTTLMLLEWLEGSNTKLEAVLPDGTRKALPAWNEVPTQEWTIPIQDGKAEFYLTLMTENGVSRREYLGAAELGQAALELSVEGNWTSGWSSGGTCVSLRALTVHIEAASDAAADLNIAPEEVDLCLYRNGETPPETVYSLEELPGFFQQNGMVDVCYQDDYEAVVELADGDTAAAAIRVRDNYGRTTYTPVAAWRRNGSDIELLRLPQSWRPWDPLESYTA